MLALFLLLAMAGPEDEVVARIGGEPVMASDLARFRRAGWQGKPSEVLDSIIADRLLSQEGYRLGLQRDPEVVAAVEAQRRRFAAELLVAKELAALKADEPALRALYRKQDTVELQQIVVAKKEEAEALLGRLRGGSDFASEARRSLDKEGAQRGGAMPRLKRTDLPPAVSEQAFTVPVGQLLGPVQMAHFWAVLRVKSRQLGDDAGFAARREELRRGLELEHRQRFMGSLREQARVKIDEKVLSAAGKKDKDGKRVVATVYGKPVRWEAVLKQLKKISKAPGAEHLAGAAARMHAAVAHIESLVLEESAMRRGLGKAPEVTKRLGEVERGAVQRAMLARVRTGLEPPEAEIEAYYQKNLKDFNRPGRRTCGHILVATKAAADKLRKALDRGEAFATLARKHSKDRASADRGGEIGEIDDDGVAQVAKEEPALGAAIRDGAPDAVSGPLETKAGWRLVRCGATVPAGLVPFEEARELIARRMGGERAQKAVSAKVTELRARTNVTVDEAALARAASRN